jgi:uncharacterized membrane protein
MDPRDGRENLRLHRILPALAVGTGLCLVLEGLREAVYGSDLRFLLWNLVLAWIPLGPALLASVLYRHDGRLLRLVPLLAVWLLFLPNAPYIVTDVVHLREALAAPRWFDALEIGSFAATGLLLGFVSLVLVHAVLRDRVGSATAARLVAAILVLTGVGVYLGRHLRWNSWDLLTRPGHRIGALLPHLTDQAAVTHAVLASGLVAVALAGGYAVFLRLVAMRQAPGR